MEYVELLDDEGVASGLTADEIRLVARRQLVGSIFATVVIAAAAGLMALRPVHPDAAVAASQKIILAQPSFVTSQGQRVASLKQHEIELP
jgi:hypothetical protein